MTVPKYSDTFTRVIKLPFMKRFCIALLAGLGFVVPASAQSCTEDWNYYMPVTVNNTNAAALTNHQVLITVNTAALVAGGHMQADGDDIRFYDGSVCCVEYPYFIDSGMNSAATKIWVKIPSLPTGSTTFNMFYGNPTATAGSNGEATFDLFEDYNGPTYKFYMECAQSGTATPNAGTMTYAWTGNAVWIADTLFPPTTAYTAEAYVAAESGRWPTLSFTKNDYTGYGIKRYEFAAGITEAGTQIQSQLCLMGHSWASASPVTTPVAGVWSTTWVATGNVQGYYPALGALSSTSTTHAKDAPLRVFVGGQDGGNGSMTLDWIRVRKYAAAPPASSLGSEVTYTSVPAAGGFLGADQDICSGQNVVLDASSAGFSSYLWSTGATTSSITVNSGGSYWVQGTSSMSCVIGDTVVVTVLTAATPTVTAALNNVCMDDAGVPLTASPAGGTFSGPGVSGNTFTPLVAGMGNHTITYTYTDSLGCTGTGSTMITVNLCMGVAQSPAGNPLAVHPNPSAGLFTLTSAVSFGQATVEVSDVTGRVLYTAQHSLASGSPLQIDLSNEPEGMYFVKVITAESQTVIPVSLAR